jgi:hypothetical protein
VDAGDERRARQHGEHAVLEPGRLAVHVPGDHAGVVDADGEERQRCDDVPLPDEQEPRLGVAGRLGRGRGRVVAGGEGAAQDQDWSS